MSFRLGAQEETNHDCKDDCKGSLHLSEVRRIPNRLCLVSSNGKAGAGSSGLFHAVCCQRSEFVTNREAAIECALEAGWRIEGRIGTGLKTSIDVLVNGSSELRIGDVEAIEGQLNDPLSPKAYWVVGMHVELQCGGESFQRSRGHRWVSHRRSGRRDAMPAARSGFRSWPAVRRHQSVCARIHSEPCTSRTGCQRCDDRCSGSPAVN